MAKERRDVWACDAPGCNHTEPVDEDTPPGFSGVVSTVGGSGCRKEPFYACTTDHIEPAITWVTRLAQERAWST